MSVFVVILLLGVGICQAFTACDSVAGNGIACSCFNASSCATAQASDDVFFQLHNSGNPAVTSCSTATAFRSQTGVSGDCKTQSNTCAFKVTTANRLIYGRDCRDTAQEFKIQSICCVVPASAPTSTTSETTGASLSLVATTTTTTTAATTTTANSSVATTTRATTAAADTAPATRLSVGAALAIAIALALVFVHY
jgi:hypothetical protein